MISVVIPAYNEEKLIGACLESLNAQDYSGQYEVIVVDNGSTDKTADIACRLGARVVRCAQRGVTNARQAGAQSARGKIVVQADADTTYPRTWLSRIDGQFSAQPEAVAVAGRFIYGEPPWWAGIEYLLRVFCNIISVLLLGRPLIISGANFAFTKKAFVLIKGYEPDSYSSDQYNIATRLSQAGKVVYDRKLTAFTSNRAVQKPVTTIIVDLMVHLLRFSRHITETLAHVLGGIFAGLPLRLPRIRLSPGRMLLLFPILVVAVLGYGYFSPASPVFGNVYSRGESPNSEKLIALTFDDGPNEPYTNQVLDVLGKYDIQATFFLIGYNVALYPVTARRIREKGHVIGNHSYSHLADHALTTVGIKDMKLAQKVIFEITGVKPRLYRPPHGRKTPWEVAAVQREGLIEVLWSISTNELSGKPAEFLAKELIKKAKPGGIILLHDGYGLNHDDARSNKSLTVAILPLLIERLQADGYRFVTIPELLQVPAYLQASP